jgi:Flp pilus assembly protein TadG
MTARRRRRGDRGDAATEVVLAVPVMLLLVTLVIQAGLWFHGSQLVEAAAQEGVQAGRAEGGSASAAERRAREFVAELSPSIGGAATVHATRT